MPFRLSLATWNVHGFVGADGRRDAERVARVLHSLDADVVALQEVDAGPSAEADAFETLGPALGFTAIPGPTLTRPDGRYGNLLLSRRPLRNVRRLDLSQPGLEPRGAIEATLEVDGVPVRVFATHLGLARRERAVQARRLCDALDAPAGGPVEAGLVVLLGDLNEWRRPLSRTGLGGLVARFAQRSRHRTFPARAPLLALDRVLVDRPEARLRTRVLGGRSVRSISDHLPVHAHVELADSSRSREGVKRSRDGL